MAKLEIDFKIEEFTHLKWCAEMNYRNFLSMWRNRWLGGSIGAGIILFFWE